MDIVRRTHLKPTGLPVNPSCLSVCLLIVVRIFSIVSGSDEIGRIESTAVLQLEEFVQRGLCENLISENNDEESAKDNERAKDA